MADYAAANYAILEALAHFVENMLLFTIMFLVPTGIYVQKHQIFC